MTDAALVHATAASVLRPAQTLRAICNAILIARQRCQIRTPFLTGYSCGTAFLHILADVVLADASSIARIVQAANFVTPPTALAASLEANGQGLAEIVDAARQVDRTTEFTLSIEAYFA